MKFRTTRNAPRSPDCEWPSSILEWKACTSQFSACVISDWKHWPFQLFVFAFSSCSTAACGIPWTLKSILSFFFSSSATGSAVLRPSWNRITSAGILFLKDLYLSASFHPSNSFLENWTENLSLFLWFHNVLNVVFHSTLLTSGALTIRHPLYAISKNSVAFVLGLAFGCKSVRSGFSKFSFTIKEMLLINLLFEIWDHHQFQSCALPSVTFLNSVLNVQRHQWLRLLGLLKRMIFEKKQDFAIWLLLHRDDGVITLRVIERLQIVVLQIGFHWSPRQLRPRQRPWNTRR